jgi:hypothetical protein
MIPPTFLVDPIHRSNFHSAEIFVEIFVAMNVNKTYTVH